MKRSIQTHMTNLGGVIANLQTLEFYIRAVLSELPESESCGLKPNENIYDLEVGHELLECPMTNFDALGDLIRKFNKVAAQRGWGQVDGGLVEIRDALAHGRVAYPSDDHQYPHLMKFSKPANGKVRITFNEAMTPTWFETLIKRSVAAHKILEAASLELHGG